MIKMAFIYETSAILFINIKQLKFTKHKPKSKKVLVFYKKLLKAFQIIIFMIVIDRKYF